MTDARRTLGPIVLVGLASAALAAVAGTKTWAEPATPPDELGLLPSQQLTADMPLAGALALVLLAAWGVVLVTRGVVRRLGTGLLVLVAGALVVVTGYAFWGLDARLEEDFEALRTGVPYSEVLTRMTGWYWSAAAASVLALASAVAALRYAGSWPTMSSRYDAPSDRPQGEIRTDTDLWKALDEGHDPTAPDERPSP